MLSKLIIIIILFQIAMRRIKVRKHKRRLRSGSSTIVSHHIRKIPFRSTSGKELKKKRSSFTSPHIEILPTKFEGYKEIKRNIPPFIISMSKKLTMDDEPWYLMIDYKDFLEKNYGLIDNIIMSKSKIDREKIWEYRIKGPTEDDIDIVIITAHGSSIPLPKEINLISDSIFSSDENTPLIKIAKDRMLNELEMTLIYIKDVDKYNAIGPNKTERYQAIWNKAMKIANYEFKEKFENDLSVSKNEQGNRTFKEIDGIIYPISSMKEVMDSRDQRLKTRKEWKKIFKKYLKSELREIGIELRNFNSPYMVSTLLKEVTLDKKSIEPINYNFEAMLLEKDDEYIEKNIGILQQNIEYHKKLMNDELRKQVIKEQSELDIANKILKQREL